MEHLRNYFQEVPPDISDAPSQPLDNGALLSVTPQSEAEDNGNRSLTRLVMKSSPGQVAVFQSREISSFNSFHLDPALIRGVYGRMQFNRPSEIQALSLPLICQAPYHSLIAQANIYDDLFCNGLNLKAQNGSGKTCCFALCILSRLNYEQHQTQALVIVPTRELALQNALVIHNMGSETPVTVISTANDDSRFSRNYVITHMVVVGTMGTIQKWRTRNWLKFHYLKVVVFDEADIMLEKNDFGDESLFLMLKIDKENTEAQKPQVLLFSATYNAVVRDFAERLFSTVRRTSVRKIYVPTEDLCLDNILQANVRCYGYHHKCDVVFTLLQRLSGGQVIIFVRTRHSAHELHQILTQQRWTVSAISGDQEPGFRDRIVDEFRCGRTTILIATNVLSRGFDVPAVKLVINFDVPREHETQDPAYETYLHRVGRSGRFKASGIAFNLINVNSADGMDEKTMTQISRYFDRKIPDIDVADETQFKRFVEKAHVFDV